MKIKTTKEELIKAFQIYNQRVIDNAYDFTEITASFETATEQVNYLLSIIEEIKGEGNLLPPD